MLLRWASDSERPNSLKRERCGKRRVRLSPAHRLPMYKSAVQLAVGAEALMRKAGQASAFFNQAG
jgi:hypothetical protein